uniref:Methyltranfer_dom domain-containing protein n=1 Tax=Parastrongyloides trichosuri TaxID=131310 RepID=A0A0N4ZYU3_PARTI
MDNFLEKYEWLYKGLNTRFLADKQHEWIPMEWLEYFNDLPFSDYDKLNGASKDLKIFIENAKKFSLLKDNSCIEVDEEKKMLHKSIFNKGIKEKKASEILDMAYLVSTYCKKYNITRVVDVGCGVGHLLRSISLFSPELKCIGVECDEVLCSKVKEKSKDIEVFKLKLDSSCNKDILQEIFSPPEFSTVILSLHGCGDLQKTIIDIYLSLDKDKNPLLITIGCCYHKMKVFNENLTENIKWTPTSLRLACQERISRFFTFSNDDHRRHIESFLNRAKLECLYDFIGIDRHDLSRSDARRIKFDEIKSIDDIKKSIKNIDKISDIDKNIFNDKLIEIYKSGENIKHYIEPFTMLQYYMQAVLETKLLTSRIEYIKSNMENINVKLIPISDSISSPRNMAIVARKK